MISTGNDIVSLNHINISRTKEERFFSKILSAEERELFNTLEPGAISFEVFVWLLWSIKESAYKYLKRNNPGLNFSPILFTVGCIQFPPEHETPNFAAEKTAAGFGNGPVFKAVVTFGSNKLYSNSLVYRELISTVINGSENFENICWGIKSIDSDSYESQSAEVRQFLSDKLQEVPGFKNTSIAKNSNGIPVLLNGVEELPAAVSLSHHYNFVAYSFHAGKAL
jgi:phosphopantetheinyl transferase (holo-ACP synthase)